jgi:UDP-N-acetylmuramate: L-alanyl-gamma-D-glutamyl-meso-diaminopimelate ligase
MTRAVYCSAMKVHVVAVSGTGMGPLAGLLKSLGHDVSGSDLRFDPPIGPKLREWGIRCYTGFSADHLADRPELVVVGNLCRSDNPEARAAIELGIETTHIGGALQRFVLPGTRPLVVAGTHGKTTTSALATALLEAAGRAPGYLIGGVPKGTGKSFHPPSSQLQAPFVIEGDEYDTAFFEKTAKFLHYRAEVVVLTSLEHDHVDIYPTLESYRKPFAELVRRVPKNGCIIANADDPELQRLLQTGLQTGAQAGPHGPGGIAARVIWYGFEGAPRGRFLPDVVVNQIRQDERSSEFRITLEQRAAHTLRLSLPGRHNLANAAAALAAVHYGYDVPVESMGAALASFEGVARRQDLLGTPWGVSVYDDFAHHPTAVRETLRALRSRHPGARLLVVFEPRSATACRNLHQADYPLAFAEAESVLLAPLGRALPAEERLDTEAIASALRAEGRNAAAFVDLAALQQSLLAQVRPGDVVALLSNGTLGGIHTPLLEELVRRQG